MIDVAQEIAVDASVNVDVALTCVARRASLFDVDAAKERLAVLKELSKPRTPANAALHGKAMQAAREALAAEKYAEATEAATIAADVAKALYNDEKDKAPKEAKGKKKPPVLAAHNRYVLPATQVRKRIKEAEGLSDAKAAALVALVKSPNDVAAKASLGEYECFVKADWTEGLPLIALSPEPALAAVATAELEAREAVDNSRLLDVADRWWDLAERSLKGSE